MMQRLETVPRLALLLAIVWLCPAPPTAVAQMGPNDPEDKRQVRDFPGLDIEAAAGWEGKIDKSSPVPVAFLLSNFSNAPIEGRLVLVDHWRGVKVDLGEVYLSEGATRRLNTVQSLEDWRECFAEFRSGGQVLWRRELPITAGLYLGAGTNLTLVVNDSDRRFSLPELENSANSKTSQSQPVLLTTKTWQIPIHPGPLVAAQSMIFPEGTPSDDVNAGQWNAVAEWVCMGGTAFVHEDSQKLLQQLIQSAPLNPGPVSRRDGFAIRRMGLGAIYEYSGELFRDDGAATMQAIGKAAAGLLRQHISQFVSAGQVGSYYQRGGRADRNRMLVAGFFGLYTLFSGLVVMAMFRRSRRHVAVYTVVVVAVASVAAGLMGGMLRFSYGDVQVFTVTQVGSGGSVQMAKLTAQSAGGRNTRIAVQGRRPDLQNTEKSRSRYFYGWHQAAIGFPPFSYQPNQATKLPDVYQVDLPISPWGQRDLVATSFDPELSELEIKIDYKEPPPHVAASKGTVNGVAVPAGEFTFRVVNTLPFSLLECRLWVGISGLTEPLETGQLTQTFQMDRYGNAVVQRANMDGSTLTFVHSEAAGDLVPDQVWEKSVAANFDTTVNNRAHDISWENGRTVISDLQQPGTAKAWLVGRIDASPGLQVAHDRSDFRTHDEFHLFIQEVPLADLPPSLIPTIPSETP